MDRRVASADFSGTDSTVGLLQNWNAGNTAGLWCRAVPPQAAFGIHPGAAADWAEAKPRWTCSPNTGRSTGPA